MADITSNANGFSTCSYSLTALPLIPYLKLQGFGADGITWEDIEPATVSLGADGLATVNQKPILRVCSFSLLANSPCRNALDLLVDSLSPVYGKTFSSATIVMTEKNKLTGYTYIYSGGSITSAQGGNNNNLSDGQQPKTYKITFTLKTPLPL